MIECSVPRLSHDANSTVVVSGPTEFSLEKLKDALKTATDAHKEIADSIYLLYNNEWDMKTLAISKTEVMKEARTQILSEGDNYIKMTLLGSDVMPGTVTFRAVLLLHGQIVAISEPVSVSCVMNSGHQ